MGEEAYGVFYVQLEGYADAVFGVETSGFADAFQNGAGPLLDDQEQDDGPLVFEAQAEEGPFGRQALWSR